MLDMEFIVLSSEYVTCIGHYFQIITGGLSNILCLTCQTGFAALRVELSRGTQAAPSEAFRIRHRTLRVAVAVSTMPR